jgi:OHS family lactose permease-like MFS transporter
MANTYIPTMFTSEGLSASTASVILSMAVLCELPIVFYSSSYMDRFSNKVLMITAIFVTLLQFLSYSVSLPLVLQIITTFMAKHTMGMLFIMVNLKAVNTLVEPHHQITALAFAATIKNLMSIVFQTVGGTMIDSLGYHPLFLISSIAMIICLIMTALFKIPSGNDLKLFSGK